MRTFQTSKTINQALCQAQGAIMTPFIFWPLYMAIIMNQLGMFDSDIYNPRN